MKLSKKQLKNIHKFVYEYKTKHDDGFINSEIENVKFIINKLYGPLNEEKFKSALEVITCQMDNKDGFIIHHCDIENAIRCGLENRDLTIVEFD